MLPLVYLDKLLDEIQLRFRDKYLQDLKVLLLLLSALCGAADVDDLFQEANFFRSFEFYPEFDQTLRAVEMESKEVETRRKNEMRTFEDSAKSKKTIASMIENKENKNSLNNNKTAAGQFAAPAKSGNKQESLREVSNSADGAKAADDDDAAALDEQRRLANLSALQKKMGGPGKKGQAVLLQYLESAYTIDFYRSKSEEPEAREEGQGKDLVGSLYVWRPGRHGRGGQEPGEWPQGRQ
jgi:signal recognition particle receptor subunit alpha